MVLCVCGAYIFSVYNLIISKVNLIYIDPSTVRVKSQQQSHKDQMNSVFAGEHTAYMGKEHIRHAGITRTGRPKICRITPVQGKKKIGKKKN